LEITEYNNSGSGFSILKESHRTQKKLFRNIHILRTPHD